MNWRVGPEVMRILAKKIYHGDTEGTEKAGEVADPRHCVSNG